MRKGGGGKGANGNKSGPSMGDIEQPAGECMTSRTLIGCGLAVTLCSGILTAAAADSCSLQSAPHRVTLVELYTSEGCNSCPPADRWLSALPQRGVTTDNAVLLAFHVDYWNQLGWPDRFSQARFSDRQRAIAARSRSGVIYTPQIVLDGHDLRAGTRPEDLSTAFGSLNAQPARATIHADFKRVASSLRVTGDVQVLDIGARPESQVWLAIYESGLSSRVTAGENSGKVLNHDFVVRELAGPFTVGADGSAHFEQSVHWAAEWNAQRTGVALFVERRDSGEIVQAAALPRLCGS
jgi:hypothetical protein